MLDGIAWPPGYRYRFGGSTKDMQERFGYAVAALALAVVFIYMILASQFTQLPAAAGADELAAADADRRGAGAADVPLAR